MSAKLEHHADRLAPELPRPKVVVAIEPRIYREAIGGAIRITRPHLEVAIVDPEELGEKVECLEHGLVICDRSEAMAANGGPAWIEFRPYDGVPTKICIDGRRWELEETDFDDLLRVVDEVERLVCK